MTTHARKALIVGIDYYQAMSPLFGCVNDAHAVKAMLEHHSDASVNFDVKMLMGTGASQSVNRADLKNAVRELFSGHDDVELFYFAGHGHIEATGGYLCASDCQTGDAGLPLSEVVSLANKSAAANKVILLDSCHSGVAGDHAEATKLAEVSEGVTILTASTKDQYATEEDGAGVFTGLLVDALGGAAANLVGDITPASVYAHIDQSLGSWGQRPVFKTNVKRFVSLRKVQPALEPNELRQIATLFPRSGYDFQLDPTFEPERPTAQPPLSLPDPIPENTHRFAILQKYNRVHLLKPVDAPHMWHAAMQSKSCKLTSLGEHYRRLALKRLL
jgi:hypothetical protein